MTTMNNCDYPIVDASLASSITSEEQNNCVIPQLEEKKAITVQTSHSDLQPDSEMKTRIYQEATNINEDRGKQEGEETKEEQCIEQIQQTKNEMTKNTCNLDPYNSVSEELFSPSFWPTLTFAAEVFDSLNSVQDKLDMIEEIRKIAAAKQAKNLKHILPPAIKESMKGRPKGTKRREILLELIEKKEAKKQKLQEKEAKKKQKEKEKDLAAMKIVIKPISYFDIKDPQKNKMVLVLDPQADGNCGFRCIAHAIYGDENLRMRVKEEIRDWYAKNENNVYEGVIHEQDDVPILDNFDLVLPSSCWFDSIDCPQIVADCYNRAVAVYSETAGNTLFLPISK
ncbi:hypothetical protein EC973_003497 [Apophysomyces ossiformis]|uniref:OTU domain-containing protein n=1 Tax=Apophysomyces ossiformis TaxID=679940 RepID=A0A8H7BLP4_9FUNG|nr:hypothetical protein EC973_003497 [Apophysomyces ossiformis]